MGGIARVQVGLGRFGTIWAGLGSFDDGVLPIRQNTEDFHEFPAGAGLLTLRGGGGGGGEGRREVNYPLPKPQASLGFGERVLLPPQTPKPLLQTAVGGSMPYFGVLFGTILERTLE